MNQETLDELKQRHPAGFAGLWATYPVKQRRRGLRIPLILSAVLLIFYLLAGNDPLALILNFTQLTFSVVPSLLGFLLGGYTILIGFGNADLLRATTRTSIKSPVSLFQTMSSVFAVCILAQIFCLMVAGLLYFTTQIKIVSGSFLSNFAPSFGVLNFCGLSVLLFALTYSMATLPTMLINIFNFAQAYHYKLSRQRLDEEEGVDGNS